MEFVTGGHSVLDVPGGSQRNFGFAACEVSGRRFWLLVSADGREAYAACEPIAAGVSPAVPPALMAPAHSVPALEEVR